MGVRNAPLLAARVLATPLLIEKRKLEVVLAVVGPRFGLDVEDGPASPMDSPRERMPATVDEECIATVQVVGVLAHRVDMVDAMSGRTSYETLAAEIDRLAADPNVAGILLEVDSPGGEAAGCFDVAARIAAAAKAKPVVGVANQYAFSAGYAILSQADKVFVPQTGEVGSIGVVTTHMDMSAAAAQQGVRITHVHAGKHKVDGSPWMALSDEARAKLQRDVDTVYEQFCSTVEQGRGARLTATAAKETEADTFIGAQAVEAGLADAIGGKAEALAALRAEIGERKMSKETEAKLATMTAERDRLTARVAELEKDKAEAAKRAGVAFLEQLRADSAKLQTPLDASDLADVETMLNAGDRAGAERLARALMKGAARTPGAGERVAATTKIVPPGSDKATERQKLVAQGEAALAKAAGLPGALSADGLTFVPGAVPATK